MAEAVGVVAAAVQLAAACLSLMDAVKKIKAASSTLRSYEIQLQELNSLSCAISQNPLLQTPEIGAHTRSLLVIVDGQNLKYLLQQRRFVRTLGFLNKNRDLIDLFDTLERHKSTLSLVIHNIQAETLHRIQSDIKIMTDSHCPSSPADSGCGDMDSSDDSRDTGRPFQPTENTPPTMIVSKSYHHTSTEAPSPPASSAPTPSGSNYSAAGIQFMPHEQLNIGLKLAREFMKEHPKKDFNYGNVALDGTDQTNGSVFFGDASTVAMVQVEGSVHIEAHIQGNGQSINGNEITSTCPKAKKAADNVSTGNVHIGCVQTPAADSAEKKKRGKQVNGSVYRHLKEG